MFRLSKKELAEIVGRNSSGILIIKAKTREFVFANANACECLGYSKDEILKLKIDDLHSANNIDHVLAEFDQAIERTKEEKPATAANIPFLTKNGETLYFDVMGIKIQKRRNTYIVCYVVDINKRKKAEDQLRTSRELFSKAFQSGPLLMTISEIETGKYIEVNKNFVDVTGYTKKESIGTTSTNLGLISIIDRNRLQKELTSNGKVSGMELTLKKKSGEELYCSYFGEIITVAGKNRLLSIAEDITERKKAISKLEEATIIINNSPIVTFTWKNKKGWPVEFVSENVSKIFGYDADDFLSEQVLYEQVIHPDDLSQIANTVSKRSNEKTVNEFAHEPYRIITKDGKTKWVSDWTFVVRNETGDITHFKGIIADISDKHLIETSLQERKEDLEKFNKLATGRELKMVELKEKIRNLEEKLKKYKD